RIGPYGSYHVVNKLFNSRPVGFSWQTDAWSHRLFDSRAHIHQLIGTLWIDGVDCDRDIVTVNDFSWKKGASQVNPPTLQVDRQNPGWNVRVVREILRLGDYRDGHEVP